MFKLHHIAISVKDCKVSEEFYAIFDFKKVHTWVAEDNSLQIVHLKNKEDSILELFCYASFQAIPDYTKSNETNLPVVGVKHFALQVDSIEETKAMLEKKGINPQKDIQMGRTGIQYFFIIDPDGILIEIVQDDRTFL